MPVLLGPNRQHVMARVEWMEDGNEAKLVVTIDASGADAKDLVAIMNFGSPMAIQFVAIPVTPRSTQI